MTYRLNRYVTSSELDPSIRRFLRFLAILPPLEIFPSVVQRALFAMSAKVGSPRLSIPINRKKFQLPGNDHLMIETWEPPALGVDRPGLLYLHGGGWVIGRPTCFDTFFSLLSHRLGLKVYALNYRRAPEFAFPAALDDTLAAWQWLCRQCDQNQCLHRDGLVVGGDSAGGNLAAGLSIFTKETNGRQPDAQILIYPALSMLDTFKSYKLYGRGFLLTENMMHQFIGKYARNQSRIDTRLSPLDHSNLMGMPATFMALAGCDILFDQGLEFASRLRQAGNSVEVAVYPQVMHAFLNYLRFDAAWLATEDMINSLEQLFLSVRNSRLQVA